MVAVVRRLKRRRKQRKRRRRRDVQECKVGKNGKARVKVMGFDEKWEKKEKKKEWLKE